MSRPPPCLLQGQICRTFLHPLTHSVSPTHMHTYKHTNKDTHTQTHTHTQAHTQNGPAVSNRSKQNVPVGAWSPAAIVIDTSVTNTHTHTQTPTHTHTHMHTHTDTHTHNVYTHTVILQMVRRTRYREKDTA